MVFILLKKQDYYKNVVNKTSEDIFIGFDTALFYPTLYTTMAFIRKIKITTFACT